MSVCGCYIKQPSRAPFLNFLALAAGDMVHAYLGDFFGLKRTFMYKWIFVLNICKYTDQWT